jgi:hypothetical protein
MVQHRVAHYEVWRKAYDGFSDAQKTAGVTRQSVYRADDDPNNLLVIHGFATTAEAEKFLTGAELRDAMRQAVSRASHESRSTRTCSRPGKPGSPRSPVRLPGWPGCAFGHQLLNRAEDWSS